MNIDDLYALLFFVSFCLFGLLCIRFIVGPRIRNSEIGVNIDEVKRAKEACDRAIEKLKLDQDSNDHAKNRS